MVPRDLRCFVVVLLAMLFFVCLPMFAAAQDEAEVVVAEADEDTAPEVLSQRRSALYIAPVYSFVFDGETHDALGDVYGGHLAFRYFLFDHFSVGAALSYQVGYAKKDRRLDYLQYRQISNWSTTPFYATINVEFLPAARVNPYLGLGAGGLYFAMEQSPEDIESPIPLEHNELSLAEQRLLSLLVGKVGLDVRINQNVGIGAEVMYYYVGESSYEISLPQVKKDYPIDVSQLAVHLGLVVYY